MAVMTTLSVIDSDICRLMNLKKESFNLSRLSYSHQQSISFYLKVDNIAHGMAGSLYKPFDDDFLNEEPRTIPQFITGFILLLLNTICQPL